MSNLHRRAAACLQSLCPSIKIIWKQSDGYKRDDTTKRDIPQYVETIIYGQIQPLSTGVLTHPNGLNITGYEREVWLDAQAWGVVRDKLKGGDLFKFLDAEWLVVRVPEQWDFNGWSHIIVRRQGVGLQLPN